MSYYHQDSQYNDYGNHSNEYIVHNEYSDHTKPNYPDPTPSKPKPNHYKYDNRDHEGNTDEWETEPEGLEYEHGESDRRGYEGEVEIDELGELKYKNEVAINEGYKLGELKHG